MKRIHSLDPDKMSDEQLKVYNKIISGPRGKFGGPFPVLLRLPKAADLIQEHKKENWGVGGNLSSEVTST